MRFAGSPVAYAGAGVLVTTSLVLAVALATERQPSPAERDRLRYAECLDRTRGPGRRGLTWPDARVEDCSLSRALALTSCAQRGAHPDCAAAIAAVDADPDATARLREALDAPKGGLLGSVDARPERARRALLAAAALTALVLALGRPPPARAGRVAAGALFGLFLGAIPALAGAIAAILAAPIIEEGALAFVGFGLVAAPFAALFGMPGFAGALDAGGGGRTRRVHTSLAVLGFGLAAWNLLVGPLPSERTAPYQAATALLLTIAGYFAAPASAEVPRRTRAREAAAGGR